MRVARTIWIFRRNTNGWRTWRTFEMEQHGTVSDIRRGRELCLINACLRILRGQVWSIPDISGLISPTAWLFMVILQWARYMRGECLLESGMVWCWGSGVVRKVNPRSNHAGPQLHYQGDFCILSGPCVKTDLSRNHCVQNTLHPTRCYVMLCYVTRFASTSSQTKGHWCSVFHAENALHFYISVFAKLLRTKEINKIK